MKIPAISSFPITLDRTAYDWADKFAAGQTSIAKGRQVYLNTLAVWAVRQYLSYVGQLDLQLSHGDSWQVELQSIMNVADLVIPHFGKIECVPVLPNITEILLAPEVIDERVGYVMVQFSEDLSRVEILGFIPQQESNLISINQLKSLDNLLDLIYSNRINNLSEFLAGILGIDWEPIGNLIATAAPTASAVGEFVMRNTLTSVSSNSGYDSIQGFTASKMINLRAKLANISLLLLIGLNHESDGQIKVKIRLHSGDGGSGLPANIELILQAIDGELLSQVQYPKTMNFIQLQSFKLPPGTKFKIQVGLGDDRLTESFIA